ncbi:MAG: putative Fe-S cluster assembly protein SufT [Verrucomicrobiota bacterium]|nr:putative Fe-S cluster assembly protein SufT [Verrucomicrobiota bacterium]
MDNTRTTDRDIPATIVPYGDAITLPAGTKVTITHRLGGNFTVLWERGMARITGEYAEAIGEPVQARASADSAHAGPPEEEALWEALRGVFDPEIPVNIVDLGLVYKLETNPGLVEEGMPARHVIDMDMTLTAPGCGMGPAIAQDAKGKLEQIPGVSEARVNIVWDPPWSQNMISEKGKMELGLI